MIAQRYIEEWRAAAPWTLDAQVEQDLVIARTLVEMYSDDLLKASLAFRGGTALHKLYLQPQIRYSEDIDLVQINSEPINPILKRMRKKLDFLGIKRTVKQHIHNNTVIYRFDSEMQPVVNVRSDALEWALKNKMAMNRNLCTCTSIAGNESFRICNETYYIHLRDF